MGLLLLVQPSGGKLWRLKYRIAGKEKKLSLGRYPEVALKERVSGGAEARKLNQLVKSPRRAEGDMRMLRAAGGRRR